MKKPDRRFYEIVCERLEVRPPEAIFLDDVQASVEGAERAGMTAIAFVSNEQAIAELEARLGIAPTVQMIQTGSNGPRTRCVEMPVRWTRFPTFAHLPTSS